MHRTQQMIYYTDETESQSGWQVQGLTANGWQGKTRTLFYPTDLIVFQTIDKWELSRGGHHSAPGQDVTAFLLLNRWDDFRKLLQVSSQSPDVQSGGVGDISGACNPF